MYQYYYSPMYPVMFTSDQKRCIVFYNLLYHDSWLSPTLLHLCIQRIDVVEDFILFLEPYGNKRDTLKLD